jgi:hypothetical protein
MITIRLDEKRRPAAKGDIAELSFSVADEVISVGTWRVSAVKEDGTVEAEPVEIEGKPNIGMEAVLYSREGRPEAAGKQEPSAAEKGSATDQQPIQTGKEKTSIEKESKSKSIEETLASFSKAAVPITFPGTNESFPCESGKIRIDREKIEMTASGGAENDFCTLRMSDNNLENFYATAKVSLNTDSHNDFMIGFIYGDKSGGLIKPDSVIVTLSQMSSKVRKSFFTSKITLLAWVAASRRSTQGKGHNRIVEKFLPGKPSNPTPGILGFLKTGQKCRIFWNGEDMGSWEEPILSNGYLWLAFTPVVKGKATATFEEIRIFRLN